MRPCRWLGIQSNYCVMTTHQQKPVFFFRLDKSIYFRQGVVFQSATDRQGFLPHSCGGYSLLTPFSCFITNSSPSRFCAPSHVKSAPLTFRMNRVPQSLLRPYTYAELFIWTVGISVRNYTGWKLLPSGYQIQNKCICFHEHLIHLSFKHIVLHRI
jgi:hypothetical protein